MYILINYKKGGNMKTNYRNLLGIVFMAVFTLTLLSFTAPSGIMDDWGMPANYKSMENPYADAGDEDDIGEDLYKQHCRSCHGNEGYGDGSKAAELETEMRELGSEDVQAQSDGELFYKSIIGRDEMPNFEKKIRGEEDRWMVINYLRTLAE
jgi:mono/diheme cytochrome c family protein